MRLLLALALLVVPAFAAARVPKEMVEIREGQPVTIRPDRAYLLFRNFRPPGVPDIEPVFLRIPSEAERTAGTLLNVQNIDESRPFVRGRPESVYLVEVVPGDYVLYGASYGSMPARLYTCMCLGTVGFSAPPGIVTDLGHFLADNVVRISTVPELRPESGFGPSMNVYMPLVGATMRPAAPGLAVPEALHGANVRAAQYRAVGKFTDPGAMSINRLVPIAGVLGYDGGRVVDVASGRVAPDIY